MPDVLFIKTSSLGDVVHHMPALTEARARLPDARFAWVVEEAFAPLVRLHPALGETIPVAGRKWRKALGQASTWGQIGHFVRQLRGRRYDAIVDTQGLLFKSALIAGAAVGWQQWQAYQAVQEAEELDAQLLSSDLPIDAYLDRGFQAWLRTSYQR